MRFPLIVRHRKAEVTLYGRTKHYPAYRVAYYAAGKRHVRRFGAYAEAREAAERIVRELAAGSAATVLTAAQARDALAALDRLEGLRQHSGRAVSLLGAVAEFAEASIRLEGRSLAEAVEGYLNTVAAVKRQDIAGAVEEFIRAEEPRTKAAAGQRAQLSPRYAYQRSLLLRRFAGTFPNTAVCELSRTHLDAFIGSLKDFSPKTRNHHREAARRFLAWCARQDYLAPTHRLFEADCMRPEHANTAEVGCYTPAELRALLEAAEGPLRVVLAIGGLAGLRTAELLRLDWGDVWRVPGHIEVTAAKAKTRARRLVEVCPALAAWLAPFRANTAGKLWTLCENAFQIQLPPLCQRLGVVRKPNGLRHSYCTYHFALHSNENLTAAQAGNSPAMIHAHYKGLATKAEAEKWFTVAPVTAENVIPLNAKAVANP